MSIQSIQSIQSITNSKSKKRTFDDINDINDIDNIDNNNYCMFINNGPTKNPKLNDDDIKHLNNILFPKNIKPSNLSGPLGPSDPSGPSDQFNNATKNRSSKKIENMCNNPLCNHKGMKEDPRPVQIPNISSISTIDDLIALGKSYHCKKNTEFAGMNLRIMCNLITPLTELSGMIGMSVVKEHIVNQILFFLQGNHTSGKCNNCVDCSFKLPCLNSQTEMLHTAITGPPGVGKTEFGKILGKVYKEMGILSKGTFKLVTRADLIAGYLGQTAIKTQKVIDEARGGVLFIDEAYSLGNSELRDSFSKECIDTLNQNLSERRDFLCIIAGYENELEKCFFNFNDGLRRRFTFRYNMVPYNSEELLQIFERKLKLINWTFCYTPDLTDSQETLDMKKSMRNTVLELFKKNTKSFPNYGGDMETLLLNCKISHTKRCSMIKNEKRNSLSIEDIENGLKTFVSHRRYDKKISKEYSNIPNVDFETNTRFYS